MTIEIRDCFDGEGVTLFFSWDDIDRLTADEIDAPTVLELSGALKKCKTWREDCKVINTRRVLKLHD